MGIWSTLFGRRSSSSSAIASPESDLSKRQRDQQQFQQSEQQTQQLLAQHKKALMLYEDELKKYELYLRQNADSISQRKGNGYNQATRMRKALVGIQKQLDRQRKDALKISTKRYRSSFVKAPSPRSL